MGWGAGGATAARFYLIGEIGFGGGKSQVPQRNKRVRAAEPGDCKLVGILPTYAGE